MVVPVSGVQAPFWLPVVVAFVVSSLTSMAGVSGAFLLLPFQMSVLGFTSPAVSATNLIFNIVAIPSGVYRYLREGRMAWPLAWTVVAGSAPGVILGGFIRLSYLPDPKPFIAFVGCVLFYVGAKVLLDLVQDRKRAREMARELQREDKRGVQDWKVHTLAFSWQRLAFEFQGQQYECRAAGLFLLSLLVGMVGGIYGIGGGAIIAPFFVAICGFPVHSVAGATLMGTFVTSLSGIAFYQLAAPSYEAGGMVVAPDWLLGFLFGVGGMAGMYLGARAQRFVPSAWLKAILGLIVVSLALRYLMGYLLG